MTTPRPPLSDSYEGLLDRARNAVRVGDLAESIVLYQRLVAKLQSLNSEILGRRPDLFDLHRQARLELVNLLRLEGRYTEAVEVEEVLLHTHPEQADTWRTDIAVLRMAQGHVEEGLAELRTLAEAKPDDTKRWLILGREYRFEGRFAESQTALDRAVEVMSQDNLDRAQVYYQRFLLFKEMGRPDDALAAWEEALSLDPQAGSTIREVYSLLTDAGRYGEAQRYVDRDDNSLQSGFQRGLILSLTGNASEAKQEWRRMANLDPDKFEYGHDGWVESVLRLGDPVPALKWLQKNLGRYPTPRLFVLSGIAWAMHKNPNLAAKLFQQAINLLRQSRPVKQKLSSADWRLLNTLVADEQMKTTLKSYFAVVETLWG